MFFGRKEQLEDLEALWRKKTSSLVACRGRRRIGKSTLFREFARRTAGAYLEFEGLPPRDGRPVPNAEQLAAFAAALARQTNSPILTLPNWYDAFFWLDKAIDDSRIRKNHELDGVPLVAVTADNDVGATFDASLFAEILTKPVTAAKLKLAMMHLFPDAR